jgi:hypothetical protein
MNCEVLLRFLVKQQKLARKLVTRLEAGGYGFHRHCRIEELGIRNYVPDAVCCFS